MNLLLVLLLFPGQEETCRSVLGCHLTHTAEKVSCPRCGDREIAANDAACRRCAARDRTCRHCGRPRRASRRSKPEFPTVAAVKPKIEELRRGKPPSVSVGSLSRATLRNAAELPVEGTGYRISSPGRKAHFGTDEMVFGLMELGARMHDRFAKDGVFLVGDISGEEGGRLGGHINHQGGRDVDLGLYICDERGRPQGNRMVTFDAKGESTGTARFDVARNWEFVAGMIENSEFGEIRAIYLADWLKKLLLDHARAKLEASRSPAIRMRLSRRIDAAERLLSQPRSSPHANHYHLSLKCTKADAKEG